MFFISRTFWSVTQGNTPGETTNVAEMNIPRVIPPVRPVLIASPGVIPRVKGFTPGETRGETLGAIHHILLWSRTLQTQGFLTLVNSM